MTKLIAHRGASLLALENTKKAFELAGASNKVYGIETDIWLTPDNVWVCTHDSNPFRNKTIHVNESKYSSFKKECLSIAKPKYLGNEQHYICTFDEYLFICKKYHKSPIIEIKQGNLSIQNIKELIDKIKKYNLFNKASFISFELTSLELIKSLEPKALCFDLINVKCKFFSNRKAIKRSLRQKNNISVCYTMASRVTINNVHKQGLLISAWTIDNKRIAHKLVKRNLDFITTNDINLLD